MHARMQAYGLLQRRLARRGSKTSKMKACVTCQVPSRVYRAHSGLEGAAETAPAAEAKHFAEGHSTTYVYYSVYSVYVIVEAQKSKVTRVF